ncbi:methylated-DNA--[protein]-cysteine S-methyltransferase [Lapillicoccus jejuensis]|uniref:Methylated-DNA--protein-cysteine methyltransferase n=1 Tax=Lapillicoccus jejuensis TaxID=402171 RepID=A0A542DXP0_9MICO|nr:methylated-DNA--[protein]-cysteine S-methyltransferase [Lapillicoccus jejuensis]TQJ07849.1 methylated-DNA-[protein]-cysteine S-methyltransferase [Lapillicoccus jejuensis]
MTTADAPATWHTTLPSPLGPLTAVRDEQGLTGLYFEGHSRTPDRSRWGAPADDGFAALAAQLEQYFAGVRTTFDIPLHVAGTPFQRAVWDLLREIPTGTTTTYGALSARLGGGPAHPRAVGHAVGANPVSVLVPCHRVVGATGSLTGYAGGLERKRHLLTLEGVLAMGESVVPAAGQPALFAL